MFCRNCGTQLNEEMVFCNGCGARVKVSPETMPAPPADSVNMPMPFEFTEAVQPPVVEKHSSVGLIVTLAVVAVLVVGGGVVGGLYLTGNLDKIGIGVTRTDEGTSKTLRSPEANNEKKTQVADSDEEAVTEPGVDDSQSYALLVVEYGKLRDLGDQIGRAYEAEYGGTGFAYDVFNPSIGSSDLGTRQELVTQCENMFDTVSGAKQSFVEIPVSPAYQSQKQELVALYELLEMRMQAMLGAAEAAVGNPDESAWRPILSPASTDARVQFESDYLVAAPETL